MWEVAVKRSLGKLEATEEYLGRCCSARRAAICRSTSIMPLPSSSSRGTTETRSTAFSSPRPAIEGAAIVSRDEALRPYGVPVIW